MVASPLKIGQQESEAFRINQLKHYSSIIDANEATLKSLVALLANLCNTPFAGISVVDSANIWIKAFFGLEATSLPREGAFCAAAVDSKTDIFAVENTLSDKRFADNPLVASGPRIRFYAAAPFYADNGSALGTVWVMDTKPVELNSDITMVLRSLSAFLVQLLQQQYQCEITGLPNKSCFIRRLQTSMNQDPADLAVGAVHLQRLLNIRHVYGPEFYNSLLTVMAKRLQNWAGTDQLVAHLGSGNFVFVQRQNQLSGHTGDTHQLLSLLSAPATIQGVTVSVSANIGIASTKNSEASAAALVDMAETVVMENINNGMQEVEYQSQDPAQNQLAIDLFSSLYDDLPGNTLEPHYQPQVDIANGSIAGFEALLRWDNPLYSNVPAVKVLSAIDKMGMIPKVDLLMFRKVCRDISEWQKQGLVPPKISTNLSRTTLQSKTLVTDLGQILQEYQINAEDIILEITETGFQQNDAETAAHLKALHDAGFRLAIDDFGTGMSNISALKDTHCELLKVDREFVHGASVNSSTAALLRLIKGTAEAHHLNLLCEGVETQEDIDWLLAADIPLIQGWYFSKALPRDAASSVLKTLAGYPGRLNLERFQQIFQTAGKDYLLH